MSTRWLRRELETKTDVRTDGGDPVLGVSFGGREIRVYSPDPSEYHVDSDVVEKADELGANFIAYSNSYCGVTREAERYGASLGIEVMPFGRFFEYLRNKGVTFVS